MLKDKIVPSYFAVVVVVESGVLCEVLCVYVIESSILYTNVSKFVVKFINIDGKRFIF